MSLEPLTGLPGWLAPLCLVDGPWEVAGQAHTQVHHTPECNLSERAHPHHSEYGEDGQPELSTVKPMVDGGTEGFKGHARWGRGGGGSGGGRGGEAQLWLVVDGSTEGFRATPGGAVATGQERNLHLVQGVCWVPCSPHSPLSRLPASRCPAPTAAAAAGC